MRPPLASVGALALIIWTLLWHPVSGDDYADIEVYDVNEPRSRLLMVDGHMWFHAGRGKNMTFKTSGGGSIYIDHTDVSKLPELAVPGLDPDSIGI
ncbi:unnamed protein product [Cylicocyclus nassatus]|uniref:Uncharacterized protein n=1 Tax=Cylicocyclus nassatus TaxID=53992 RepID=A0AA36DLG4_CYLNA|nr:unnamed protein product [Cylicocyclus nassatus]